MRRTTRTLFVSLSVLVAMVAQTRIDEPHDVTWAEFEVVSVKPGDPASPVSSARPTPGRLEMRNTTLKNLVRSAYQLNEYQLDGGPKWMDSARFNIDARLPAGAPRDRIPLMLQALLADRFRLEFHRLTKTLPEYALVVAKGGPKLQAASQNDPKNGTSSQGDRHIRGWGMPIATLANMLISAVEAPVLDRTGLEGKYNFILEFAPLLGTPGEGETLPAIFEVIQERLGLKLEAIKGPVDVLVIDRAEKPPQN